MNVRTDELVSGIILILVGVGQATQFLHFGNLPSWLIVICLGLMYMAEQR